MPKPIPYKTRFVYFLTFVLVFLIGFPILAFYSAGYTFDQTFGLSVRGGMYVSTPEPNTSVFVGNDLQGVSGFFKKEFLISKLKPGQYLLLVANNQFWPWAKIVNVEKGEVEPFAPLLIPKVITTEKIEKTDSMYKDISALFTNAATSTRTSVVTDAANTYDFANATSTAAIFPFETILRKQTKVWLDKNTIYAEWVGSPDSAPKYLCNPAIISTPCTVPIATFHSATPFRTFDFYPSRSDAVVVAFGNGVYAVEIDNRPYQNFYPLYRGVSPDVRVADNKVYIKDEGNIILLKLEQ